MQQALYLLLRPVLIVQLHAECLSACLDYLVVVSELPVVGVYMRAGVLLQRIQYAWQGKGFVKLVLQQPYEDEREEACREVRVYVGVCPHVYGA